MSGTFTRFRGGVVEYQVSGTPEPAQPTTLSAADRTLSDEERRLIRLCGLSEDAYLEARAAKRAQQKATGAPQPSAAEEKQLSAAALRTMADAIETAALTPNELKIIKATGLTPAQFLEHRAELKRGR